MSEMIGEIKRQGCGMALALRYPFSQFLLKTICLKLVDQ